MSEEKLSEEEKAKAAAMEEMSLSNETDIDSTVVEETSSFDDFAAEIDSINEEETPEEVAVTPDVAAAPKKEAVEEEHDRFKDKKVFKVVKRSTLKEEDTVIDSTWAMRMKNSSPAHTEPTSHHGALATTSSRRRFRMNPCTSRMPTVTETTTVTRYVERTGTLPSSPKPSIVRVIRHAVAKSRARKNTHVRFTRK